MDESNYKHNYEYLSYNEAVAIADGTFVNDVTSLEGELVTKADIDTILSGKGKHMTSIVAGDGSEYVCYYECADDRVVTTTETVYKYSYDGTTWSTGSPYLVWAADDVTPKDVYLSIVRNSYDQDGQLISSTNLDTDGYTLSDGDLFTATISGNKATVAPKAVNESYAAAKTERLTAYATSNSTTINCTQEKKGITLVGGDVIIFEFGWDRGLDLDSATYIPQLSTNYAGFGGLTGFDGYVFFAGDNTGTGKEHTAVDFRAMKEYIENYSGIDAVLDKNGQPCVIVDIYNVWYNTKETQQISLNYTVYDYTGDSCTIERDGNHDFNLTGLEQKETSQQSAIVFAKGKHLHEDPAYWYTQTARFKYYLGSGIFSIETNSEDVAKWNKGVYTEDVDIDLNYSEELQNGTFTASINPQYSADIYISWVCEIQIVCADDDTVLGDAVYNFKSVPSSGFFSTNVSMSNAWGQLTNMSSYDSSKTYSLRAKVYNRESFILDRSLHKAYNFGSITKDGELHVITEA